MEELNKLEKDLARFPSLFNQNVKHDVVKAVKYNRSKILNVTKRLELELADENDMHSVTIICRTHNLLTFLYFLLKKYDKAMEHYRESEKVELSIIAITNRAYMHLKRQENIQSIEEDIHTLEDISNNQELVLVAKAEIGHAYTRCGIQLYKKAVTKYTQVLKEANYLHTVSSCSRWKENISVWTFSLAMAKKRMVHQTNTLVACDISVESYKSIFDLYNEIIATWEASGSRFSKTIKGRALVEIGLLAHSVETNKSIFKKGLLDFFENKGSVDFISSAVALNDSDSFVLERCGRYYRYISNNEQVGHLHTSIDLLQRAVEIKPTNFAYHHLALSLKRQLEMEGGMPGLTIRTKNDNVRRLDLRPTHCHNSTVQQRGSGTRDEAGYNSLTSKFRNFTLNSKGSGSSNEVGVPPEEKTPQSRTDFQSDKNLSESQQTSRGRMYSYNWRRGYVRGRSMTETESFSKQSREKTHVMQMIKCPKKPKHIFPEVFPNQVAKVHHLLDKAIGMGNVSAQYDKGLYYRQLGDANKALAVFKELFCNKQCSMVQLSNAYEQAALCIDEKVESTDTTDTEMLETDMVHYLKHCMEILCNIVANIPCLKDCWEAAPTLEQFLERRGKTKQTLKDLCFLYEKMENYDGAIKILNELRTSDRDEGKEIEVIDKLIKNYFKEKDYNSAALAFDMIMCLPDGHSKVNENLFLQVHIEGAFEALTKSENEIARLRLRNALDFNLHSKTVTGVQNVEDECTSDEYDIFVLCETENIESGEFFISILDNMGLSVTLNANDAIPGRTELEGLGIVMNSSKHYIALLSSDQPTPVLKHRYSMMQKALHEKNSGGLIVITTDPGIRVPTMFTSVPQLTLNFEELLGERQCENIQGILSNKPRRKTIKDILMKLSEKIP